MPAYEPSTGGNNTKKTVGTANVDENGVAELVVHETLSPGTYVIQGTYVENDTYESSTSTGELEVLKYSTSMTITLSKNEYYIGESVVLQVSLVDDDGNSVTSGAYTVYDGESVIQQNYAVTGSSTSVSFTPATVGTHSIRVVYGGTGTYNSCQSSVDVVISKLDVVLTPTGRGYLYPDTICGRQFTIVDSLGEPVTTGKIIVKVNTKTVKVNGSVVTFEYDANLGCFNIPSLPPPVKITLSSTGYGVLYQWVPSTSATYNRGEYSESITCTDMMTNLSASINEDTLEDGTYSVDCSFSADNLVDILEEKLTGVYVSEGDFLKNYPIEIVGTSTAFLICNDDSLFNGQYTPEEYASTLASNGINAERIENYTLEINSETETLTLAIEHENITSTDTYQIVIGGEQVY